MQKDLRQKAADELEDVWKNRLTDSQKAEEDVKRFLQETFPVNSNEDKVVLLKLRLRRDRRGPRKQWSKQLLRQWRKEPTFDNCILPHASKFGLDYEYIPGSRFDDPPHKWQAILLMVRAEEEARALIEEGSREVLRASKKQGWHVTGEWHISWPAFEKKFDVEGMMKLTIYTLVTSSCLQIFSEFDFGIVAGVFRFEEQSANEPRTEADSSSTAKLHVAQNNRRNEMQAGGRSSGLRHIN
ncbi:hypothetical protein EAF00_005087 [Botryotinia globosa]|nr:hypothetical protein EAF00_005087 [Botryotinia globosa]